MDGWMDGWMDVKPGLRDGIVSAKMLVPDSKRHIFWPRFEPQFPIEVSYCYNLMI
jgi:hypothetical protein